MNENSDSSRSPLRFFRFGTRTLLLLVTVLCVGLAWHVYKTNDRNRLICEKLVDTELLNIHFQSWETDPNAAQLIKAFASDLSTTAPTFESHVLYSNGTRQDGSAADDFERALVNHWSKASETDNEHAVGLSNPTTEPCPPSLTVIRIVVIVFNANND